MSLRGFCCVSYFSFTPKSPSKYESRRLASWVFSFTWFPLPPFSCLPSQKPASCTNPSHKPCAFPGLPIPTALGFCLLPAGPFLRWFQEEVTVNPSGFAWAKKHWLWTWASTLIPACIGCELLRELLYSTLWPMGILIGLTS